MKTLVLLSLSLAVALGMPPNPPGVPQSPALTEENQKSLDGVWVPVQGGVALEDPAEKVREEQDSGAKTDVGPDVEEEPGVKTDLESEADLSPAEAEMTRDVQEIQEEEEPATEEEMEERHMDMERTVGEPIMELEPLDDHNMENLLRKDPLPEEEMKDRDNVLDGEPIMELEPLDEDLSDVEKSLKAAFNNQNPVLGEEPIMELEPLDDDNMEKSLREEPVNQPLPEEEVMEERHNVLDEEPIMELEPLDEDLSDVEKSLKAASHNQNPVLGEEAIMELEPVDDNNNMEKSLREELVNQPLPEEEEEVMKDDVLDGEPIMELEPLDEDLSDIEKTLKAAFNNQNPVLGEEPIMELEPLDEAAVVEEEGGADVTGHETPSLEEKQGDQ